MRGITHAQAIRIFQCYQTVENLFACLFGLLDRVRHHVFFNCFFDLSFKLHEEGLGCGREQTGNLVSVLAELRYRQWRSSSWAFESKGSGNATTADRHMCRIKIILLAAPILKPTLVPEHRCDAILENLLWQARRHQRWQLRWFQVQHVLEFLNIINENFAH